MSKFARCPTVVSQDADARFRSLVEQAGHDPDDRWIGGYVAYEWEHVRHVLQTREEMLAGRRVLEFGCNYGAASVVLAALGADVCGIDIDARIVCIARANIARFGFSERVHLLAQQERDALPFADETFDIVLCSSVIEYVAAADLPRVQREIDRVLKPGGRIIVTGTSNRLSPREFHSGRWLVNYLPRRFDRWLAGGSSLQRGVMPCLVRYGFGKRYENLDWLDGGRAYLEARRRFAPDSPAARRAAHWLARRLGVTLGLLTPSISITLRKPER